MDFWTVVIIISLVLLIVAVVGGSQLKKLAAQKVEGLYNKDEISEASKDELLKFISSSSFKNDHFEYLIKQHIHKKKRWDYLTGKYGEKIATKISREEFWIGMSTEHLRDAKGEPDKVEIETLKTKTKETWVYGNKNSGDYFVFENGEAVKIVDR